MNLSDIIKELQRIEKDFSYSYPKNKSVYEVPDLSEYDHCKLCYIYKNTAYFTSKELDEVWGDDWDDAPYEHNAGEPYDYDLTICFDGEVLHDPAYMQYNSRYSVKSINAGAAAWLTDDDKVSIPAGVSPSEFVKKVIEAGDRVYLPVIMKSGNEK